VRRSEGFGELRCNSLWLAKKVPELELYVLVRKDHDLLFSREACQRTEDTACQAQYFALKYKVAEDISPGERVSGEPRRKAWFLIRVQRENLRAQFGETVKKIVAKPVVSTLLPCVVLRICETSQLAVIIRLPQHWK